jgi:enoyl-CoA hydratase/carnithine racemase
MTDKIIGRKVGSVAHIVFNNPARHNATSLEMWQKVGELARGFTADQDVRVLVLSGAGGKAFVSGADISKFETERASLEAARKYNETSAATYEALYNFPRPVIAKIQGYCIGGGMNVAMCADMRIATEGSNFGVPAGRLGIGYGYAPVKRLADIIGVSRAMEMIYTAKQFTAAEAFAMGLLNSVVTDDRLEASIDELTSAITENAPLTLALVKAAAREIAKDESKRDLKRLDAMVDACAQSADFKEGRSAFMEKRKPVFQGR